MSADPKGPSGWLRYAGLGTEFAAAVAGMTLAGLWVDRHFGCSPWGVIVGAVFGLTGGMLNFLRAAKAALEATAGDDSEDSG